MKFKLGFWVICLIIFSSEILMAADAIVAGSTSIASSGKTEAQLNFSYSMPVFGVGTLGTLTAGTIEKKSSLNLGLEAYITPGFIAGLMSGLEYGNLRLYKQETGDTSTINSSMTIIFLTSKFTFYQNFYAWAGLGVGKTTTSQELVGEVLTTTYSRSHNKIGLGFGSGYLFRFGSNFSLQPKLKFYFFLGKDDPIAVNIGTSFIFSPTLAIGYHF